MATSYDDLITRYLEQVAAAIEPRVRHTGRIVAEVEDHLRSASEQFQRDLALSPEDADRRAIACFGPEEELAASFLALEREGGAARPTPFTIRAGLAGLVGGFVIALAAAAQVVDDAPGSSPRGVHAVIAFVFAGIAMGLVAIGFAGIVARHRGTLRALERVGLGLIVLGFAVMWTPYWGALAIAVPLMLAGTIIVGVRVYRVHALPRPPLTCMLVAGGVLIGLTVSKSDKTSVEFAASWIVVLAGWCWLQFTLLSEHPVRRAR